MKPFFVFVVALGCSLPCFSQLRGTVKDTANGKPIPYVNIWIEGKNEGTTSDTEGNFELKFSQDNSVIILSAVGYKTKRIKTPFEKTIYMVADTLQLPELQVSDRRDTKTITIDTFKRREIKGYFASNDKPWIVVKYYPYKDIYEHTKFLKTIRFLSDSKIKDAILNVRLYQVGEDGKPGEYLTNENILVTVPKGKRVITIDVEKYALPFPKKGFFIGLENLLIGRNRYRIEYTVEGDKSGKKYSDNRYAPCIGYKHSSSDDNCWVYQGSWAKYYPFWDKPIELALEIVLTN